MLSQSEKLKVLSRLRKVEGQVAGIQRMVQDDKYCVDVLLQIAAAQGALGKVGQIVLGSHIETCVSEALKNGNEEDRCCKVEELIEVFARYANIGSR